MAQSKVSTIAPKELTNQDFGQNIFVFDEQIPYEIDTALRVLTTEGHATRGHCAFGGLEFPETSQLDVANNLFTPEHTQKIRERVSEEVVGVRKFNHELIDILFGIKNPNSSRVMGTKDKLKFADPRTGDYLFGFGINKNTFEPTRENILAVLKGATLGNLMDSDEYRMKTVQRFQKTIDGKPLTIGNGSCHVGHLGNLRKRKVSLEQLACDVVDPEYLQHLYKTHCLVEINSMDKKRKYSDQLFPVFVRTTDGLGCCDDLTTLGIGFLHYNQGFEKAKLAYIGSRNSDFVDTTDKMTAFPVTGGSDEYIGKEVLERYNRIANDKNAEIGADILSQDFKIYTTKDTLLQASGGLVDEKAMRNFIHQRTRGAVVDTSRYESEFFPSELVTLEDITSVIYFGAKNNTPEINMSDSVRRFEEKQHIFNTDGSTSGHRKNPTEAHMHYLQTGEATPGLLYGFKRIPSSDFYDIANQRLDAFCNFGIFPEPQFQRPWNSNNKVVNLK